MGHDLNCFVVPVLTRLLGLLVELEGVHRVEPFAVVADVCTLVPVGFDFSNDEHAVFERSARPVVALVGPPNCLKLHPAVCIVLALLKIRNALKQKH